MPSDIHEAANTTKEGWIAWFCPLKLYRHYSGCRIWSGLLYRNYIKLYVSFCAARPGFVAYLFVVQYTTAVLYRCFYIRFVLPLIRANRTNYRYYFFDYLYFKGEQGHKMRSRCSGVLMLSLYWWFIIEIPCIPLFDRNLPHTWYLLCCMGMFLFPVLFCLVRYRKDRTSALVNHYRHSSKNKITITLLLLLPMVLCGFELWLLAKLGWIICKWC